MFEDINARNCMKLARYEYQKTLLFSLWKCIKIGLPTLGGVAINYPPAPTMRIMYNEFVNEAKRKTFLTHFEQLKKVYGYPYERTIHSDGGTAWAVALAWASLEMPSFFGRTPYGMSEADRLKWAKETVVAGLDDVLSVWTTAYLDEVFKQGMKLRKEHDQRK